MARYRVNSDQGINVRDQPGGTRVGGLANGAIVDHDGGGPQDQGGYTWIKVKAEDGGLEGWVAKEFLSEIGDDQHKDDHHDHDQSGGGQSGGSGSQTGDIGGSAGIRAKIIATAASR